MTYENVEVENNKPIRKCRKITTNLDYESIMPRSAAQLLSQLEYWWSRKKGPELYKSDQELAKELGISLRLLKYAKKYLSKNNIITLKVHWRNGKKVTFYNFINYTNIESLIRANNDIVKCKKPTLVKCKVCPLDNESKVQSLPLDSANIALNALYTNNTTDITYNPAGLKNELPSNEPELGNLSNEQKSGSEVDRSAFREESLDVGTPTPNSEQSNQEEKTVEPHLPLKAEDVKTSKESKGKGKVSKPKSNKVAKTPINPEMELTPELRNIALDVRVDGRGLKEGYVDSEFKIFRNKYVGNQRKEERWDLKWEEWCTKAIGWDEYSKKSMVNPPRTTVSDKPAEVKPINLPEEIRVFLDNPYNSDLDRKDFADCIFEDRGDRIVIKAANQKSYDEIEFREGRLKKHFGKDVYTELFSKDEISESVNDNSPDSQPIQIQPTSAQPIQLSTDDFNIYLEQMRMSEIVKLAKIEDDDERFMKLHKLEQDFHDIKNTYRINHDILNIGLIAQKYGLHGLFGGNL